MFLKNPCAAMKQNFIYLFPCQPNYKMVFIVTLNFFH